MAKVFRTLSDVREDITSEALSQQPLLTDDYTYDTVNDRRKSIEDNFDDVNETLDETSDTDTSGEYVAPAEDLPVVIEPENDLLTGKPKQPADQQVGKTANTDNEIPVERTSGNAKCNGEKANATYNDLQDEFLVDEIIIVQEIPDDMEDLPDNLADATEGNKNNPEQKTTDTNAQPNPCGCKKQG